MSQSADARLRAGIAAFNRARTAPGPREREPRYAPGPWSIGPWAFTGVAVTSFGGPLALAALIAPGLVADASDSAGLAMIASVAVFSLPIVIWLRYSSEINSSGGLFAFVEAAAGRRVALAQAAIWIFSYALYLYYTTIQIVYDVLPEVFPGERRYQSLLALLIPVAIVAVMVAGRAATLIVLGLMAVGQLALAGVLDGVTLAHIPTPVSSFGTGAAAGPFAKASAQTSLLYICGGLPLFLGGELATPARTIRRGVTGAFLITGLVVVLAVAPLAAASGLTGTEIPGFSVAQQYAGATVADAIGIGVAVSVGGLIVCEYLALTRLLHAITHLRIRPITAAIGASMLVVAPFTLIDPDGFYDTLAKPSLIALWASQLIVFVVYPLFAIKRRQRAIPALALGLGASALAVYGLVSALSSSSS
jgi:hypothetical protein